MNIPFADRLLYRYVLSLYHRGNKTVSVDSLRLDAVDRVLLVLTTGLGDAVLSTPVFPAVRNALPNADIRLLCRDIWIEMFSQDKNLNGLFGYYGKYRKFFKTMKDLRDFGPQLTLILHGNDPDIIPLVYLAGSDYIVRIPWKHTRFGFLLSNADRHQDEGTVDGMHYIENRLRVLDTIGVAPVTNVPYIVIPEEARSAVRKKLGLTSGYWIFHHNAADDYKVWPAAHARQLIGKALLIFPERKIILTGAAQDKKALSGLIRGLPSERIINAAGMLSLSETAACIADADFLIGPDTGILHMAAALETPTVALYAPTSASLVGPRSRNAKHYIIQKPPACSPCLAKKCPYKPGCMDRITPEEVIEGMKAVYKTKNE